VWALWGCGITPYVRHSTDCTWCDFGHLRFFIIDIPDSAEFVIAATQSRNEFGIPV
jgi:hypothetical protein